MAKKAISRINKNLEKKSAKLMLKNDNISDLSILEGLEKCKHIKELDLSDNPITDLKPLSILKDFKHLTKLSINYGKIRDLSPLEEVTQLEKLYLGNNDIVDLSPLKNFNNLRILDLNNNNNLQNINAIAPLKALEYLELGVTNVDNISAVEGFANLHTLSLSECPVQDLEPARNLAKIRMISINPKTILAPPTWWAYHLQKRGELGQHSHHENLPEIEKIWELIMKKDEESLLAAEGFAISQGWSAEDFSAYKDLMKV